jgi:hypothetical protein
MLASIALSQTSGAGIPITLDSGKIEVPVFSLNDVREDHCAMYARLVSEIVFGKKFSRVPSWDRRYHDTLVARLNGSTLKSLTSKGVLQPGMIVGSFYADSGYQNELDKRGNPREYTHNATFLGTLRGLPILAEQVTDVVLIRNEQEHIDKGMRPIEIYDEPRR